MSVNWILSRLTVEEGGEVESNFLYQSYKFHCLESGVTENVLSKNAFIDNVKCLFPNMKKGRKRKGTTNETVYRGVTLQEVGSLREVQFTEIHKCTARGINLKSTSDNKVTFEQDSTHLCNGNKVIKVLTFNVEGTFEISISGTKIDLKRLNIDSVFALNESSISTVFSIFNNIKLCTGLKFKKSLMVTRFHTLDNWESNGLSFRTLRSLSCFKVVLMNSKTSTCRVCQQQYFKKDKENIPTEIETSTCTAEISTENAIRNLFPNAPPAMLSLLQEQAKNVDRHPNGRRWSKQFITNCLHLYNRSPKCYELLVESKMLVLPSKSILILYKNSIKQEPGFNIDVFEWMHEEATRLGINENERIGGLIFDEMSIQEDIVIEKNGNILELTGFTELGEEGNLCQSLRRGTKNKLMGTHILQLLFLGINGFRFPFAHFVTDNILASHLYALFWKSVYLLSGFGFTVLYTCMDGAQCNRGFMHNCLGENPTKYSIPSTCTSEPVIFMMDISHVLKKIRNNVIKSGLGKHCTRLLTLPSSFEIHWQMFLDFYHWDQQNALQLHRKLTNEHLYPNNQLKMRNYLAEDVLNSTMLQSFKTYEKCLGEKGNVLNGLIEFLEQTSQLVEIFRDKRPIKESTDPRLAQLNAVNTWFSNWENNTKNQKSLMSYQCREDVHSCLLGFIELCETVLKMKSSVYVVPALINSDVIENIFNQQRSTYNGANSNPSAMQYKKTVNSIILGQNSISKKANAARSNTAMPYMLALRNSATNRQIDEPNVGGSTSKGHHI